MRSLTRPSEPTYPSKTASNNLTGESTSLQCGESHKNIKMQAPTQCNTTTSHKTSNLIRNMLLQRSPSSQRSRKEQEAQTRSSAVFPPAVVVCCHKSNIMAKSDDYSTERNTNNKDERTKGTRRFSSSSFKLPRRSLTSLIIKFKSNDREDGNSAEQKKPPDVTILNNDDPWCDDLSSIGDTDLASRMLID